MKRRWIVVLAVVATMFGMLPAVAAGRSGDAAAGANDTAQPQAESGERSFEPLVAPETVQRLALDQPMTLSGAESKIDTALSSATGPVSISVRLRETPSPDGNAKQLAAIERQQARFLAKATAAGAVKLGEVKRVLNAVFLEVDASQVVELAANPEVLSIKRVADYQMDLSETVPYIGASTVQGMDIDGTGVTVAVLDSGIDYTHADLGGPGTAMAYFQAYGENSFSGKNRKVTDRYNSELLFPTAKVVGGYDFVGERWPFGALRPDPDPIDFEGHGTHVADIIGGRNGVAPGVELLAVKVCSAVSTSCSGVALIQGMDFAVENGVDIINMSLGSIYGQAFDDDLSTAVENATAAGVLTVASAGNSSNKPYVTGAPAAAPSALSVAQTQVPSAVEIPMEIIQPAESAGLYEAVFQPWAKPQTDKISGIVTYGDGSGGNLNGCAAFAPGSLTGQIVAVDRGACNFSLKIQNIEAAGGILGIIITVNGAAPFPGGFGGGALPQIPAYMILDTDGDPLRAGGAEVSFDPAIGTPLVGTMVGSSARGPSMLTNIVKPEIGAPGASISAEAGTGTGVTPFGGTSGAAPMVSGSAALLLAAEPSLAPAEVKARLINTGDTDISTGPGGTLAPITRIGGGEVRVDRAVASDAAAWDADAQQGALSFGLVDTTGIVTASKTILVKNYGTNDLTFDIVPTFRYATDAALGAVSPSAPASVTVAAGGTETFDLEVTIDGSLLKTWYGNSGSRGDDPDWLDDLEIDGYLMLDAEGTSNDIHLPWHVLPRKAADIEVVGSDLVNSAVNDGLVEGYNLYAVSDDLPGGDEGAQAPVIDLKYVGGQTFALPDALGDLFCVEDEDDDPALILALAVTTWERQTHANAPALFEFDLDIDQDGVFDYAIYNADLSLASGDFDLSDGRNAVFVENLETGDGSIFFLTDHDTNSGNTVLLACSEQIGLTFADLAAGPIAIDVAALAADIYFTGNVTDSATFTMTPGWERFLPFVGGAPGGGSVPGLGSSSIGIIDFGGAGATELGLLFLYRGGAPEGNEAGIVLID